VLQVLLFADIWVAWMNNGSVCVNDTAILRCNYDLEVLNKNGQSPDWVVNGNTVNFAASDHIRSGLEELALRVTTSQPIDVSCSILIYDDNNRVSGRATSESLTVIPKDLDKPEQPTFGGMTTGKDKVMLQINHNSVCFSSHTFVPEVSGNCSTIEEYTFEFNTMTEIPFNILPQGTACEFYVSAVCQGNSNIRSELWRHTVPPFSGSGSVLRSSIACIVSSMFAVFISNNFWLLLSLYL
jgi:hypothetical protein